MNALDRCSRAGIRLWAEDGTLHYDAPKGAMTPELVADLKSHKRAILEALAHPDLPGVFAARLSAASNAWTVAIGMSPTAMSFRSSAAIASEAEDLKEYFGERASTLESDAGLPGPDAELEAGRLLSAYARNKGSVGAGARPWMSLAVSASEPPAAGPLVGHSPARNGSYPQPTTANR